MRRALLAVTLAAVTGATLLAATPAASAAGVPSKYANQQIAWKPCFNPVPADYPPGSERLLCGSFTAPMDWNHPGAHPDITVAVSKLPATGAAKGAVLTNPGGPGAPGIEMPLGFLKRTRVIAAEDLYGMDPRGTGRSTNTTCGGDTGVDFDTHNRSAANMTVVLDVAQLYADKCHRDGGAFLPLVNTEQTVKDIDLFRTLIGRDKISWIGYSGGTWLGAYYATYFPSRVDKVVLDSNTAFTQRWQQSFALQPMGFQRRFDQDFLPWLAKYDGLFHLGTTAAAVKQSYDQVLTGLDGKTFDVGNGTYDRDTAELVAISSLYSSRSFPMAGGLLAALALLEAGKPVPADLEVPVWGPGPASGETAQDAETASFFAIQCNDTPWRGSRQTQITDSGEQARKYPLIGYDTLYDPCQPWTRPDLTLLKPTGRGVPPILMVQDTNDPATPYEGAAQAHRDFAGSRLITVQGQGDHGAYAFTGNSCVDNTVESYLVDGVVPARDTTCAGVPLPDPTSKSVTKADQRDLMAQVRAVRHGLTV